MRVSRRDVLLGSTAGALAAFAAAQPAQAWFPRGQQLIGHGWNTLPLGAGGLVTGFCLANDNSIYCRTDVGNIYKWTGTTSTTTNPSDQWTPLLNFASLAGLSTNPITNFSWGGLEIVCAPSDATKVWAIFPPLANGIISPIYYSTNSGATWNYSNITCANSDPNTPPYSKEAYYRIAVDPANTNVVYVGMAPTSGNTSGVYTTLNKAGGSDGHTFSAATTDSGGTTPFPQTTNGTGAAGICFDPSATTTVAGQTVSKRIIIPVGGVDIYESVDGGVTWATTGAATAFGTAAFSLNCGVMNSNGVYYASVNSNGVYRYVGNGTAGGGTWTNISSGLYAAVGASTVLVVDPADPTYLTVLGERGLGYGSTSTNANTGSPVVWTSTTGLTGNVTATAPSYDLPWLVDIFGQGAGFFFATAVRIDSDGNTIVSGNQSIWKISGRLVYNGASNITVVSFGRGQNATVAQEVWKPTGGNNPLIAVQDFGTPIGGTFVKFPTSYSPAFSEYTCSSIEESPTDGSFCVFRITGQGGSPAEAGDASGYSTDASANVTQYAANPSAAWRGTIHGSITSAVLTVTSVDSGVIFIGQQIFNGSTNRGVIGSAISTNPDGTGTYNVTFGTGNDAGPTLQLYADNIAGQIIAADNDHHLIVAAGHSHGCIPIVTANRGASWALCNGLPSSNWMRGAWFAAVSSKSIACGFGSDVGTVWAAAYSGTTVTIYKSTDYGANFTSVSTITVSASMTAVYLLAVPGQAGHLWFTGGNAGGLWQSTDWGATWTSKTRPNSKPNYMSIGAIDPVSGTYPTLWMTAGSTSDPSQAGILYYSINGASSWTALGSAGLSGVRPDLPVGQQMYGIGTVRADRQVFKRLYCGAGQMGFCYYNP